MNAKFFNIFSWLAVFAVTVLAVASSASAADMPPLVYLGEYPHGAEKVTQGNVIDVPVFVASGLMQLDPRPSEVIVACSLIPSEGPEQVWCLTDKGEWDNTRLDVLDCTPIPVQIPHHLMFSWPLIDTTKISADTAINITMCLDSFVDGLIVAPEYDSNVTCSSYLASITKDCSKSMVSVSPTRINMGVVQQDSAVSRTLRLVYNSEDGAGITLENVLPWLEAVLDSTDNPTEIVLSLNWSEITSPGNLAGTFTVVVSGQCPQSIPVSVSVNISDPEDEVRTCPAGAKLAAEWKGHAPIVVFGTPQPVVDLKDGASETIVVKGCCAENAKPVMSSRYWFSVQESSTRKDYAEFTIRKTGRATSSVNLKFSADGCTVKPAQITIRAAGNEEEPPDDDPAPVTEKKLRIYTRADATMPDTAYSAVAEEGAASFTRTVYVKDQAGRLVSNFTVSESVSWLAAKYGGTGKLLLTFLPGSMASGTRESASVQIRKSGYTSANLAVTLRIEGQCDPANGSIKAVPSRVDASPVVGSSLSITRVGIKDSCGGSVNATAFSLSKEVDWVSVSNVSEGNFNLQWYTTDLTVGFKDSLVITFESDAGTVELPVTIEVIDKPAPSDISVKTLSFSARAGGVQLASKKMTFKADEARIYKFKGSVPESGKTMAFTMQPNSVAAGGSGTVDMLVKIGSPPTLEDFHRLEDENICFAWNGKSWRPAKDSSTEPFFSCPAISTMSEKIRIDGPIAEDWGEAWVYVLLYNTSNKKSDSFKLTVTYYDLD